MFRTGYGRNNIDKQFVRNIKELYNANRKYSTILSIFESFLVNFLKFEGYYLKL